MKAFIVVLPVTDPAGEARPVVPARFQLTKQGEWWAMYSDPEPDMQPNSNGTVGAGKWRAPRRSDTRKVLLLWEVITHVGSSRTAFMCASEDLGFLKWTKEKATAAGYLTWTKAELAADEGAEAGFIKNNVPAEDWQTMRNLLAGMDAGAVDNTTSNEIDAAVALEE